MKKNMTVCLFVCFLGFFCGLPGKFFLIPGQTKTNNFFPWPHYHLVCKQTQASLAKWLSVIYELSGCGFESRCCHLNFRYSACFEQGVP